MQRIMGDNCPLIVLTNIEINVKRIGSCYFLFTEVRQQFAEQLKCLDTRAENKVNLVNDMQEFLRKRSELELEYAKNLERLADRFSDRFHKQRNTYGLSRYVLKFPKMLECFAREIAVHKE